MFDLGNPILLLLRLHLHGIELVSFSFSLSFLGLFGRSVVRSFLVGLLSEAVSATLIPSASICLFHDTSCIILNDLLSVVFFFLGFLCGDLALDLFVLFHALSQEHIDLVL